MAFVKARKNESFEAMMRRFQRLVEQSGVMKELKRRRYYMSPSEKKKFKRKQAEKRRKKEARK
jgi:small subunit ribosomal protein S21